MSLENYIVEVHSISAAAPGWRFEDSNQPVVCFALVTVAATAHPGNFQNRWVIGLGQNDVNSDLLGMEVGVLEKNVCFVAHDS